MLSQAVPVYTGLIARGMPIMVGGFFVVIWADNLDVIRLLFWGEIAILFVQIKDLPKIFKVATRRLFLHIKITIGIAFLRLKGSANFFMCFLQNTLSHKKCSL